MESGWAEEFAKPSYKWIGTPQSVENLQGWRISLYPGGVGFSFSVHGDEGLRVRLHVTREDGASESYLSDAYYCGEWGGGWQKWQSHKLPLFPFESAHGPITHMTFSYAIIMDHVVVPSRYQYRFATLEDFRRGHLSLEDFGDPLLLKENDQKTQVGDRSLIENAYRAVNTGRNECRVTPFFTRGDTGSADHPVHEIHRAIDRVIFRKLADPGGNHYIYLAMYDFDNEHIAKHLVYAKEHGVEVECVGDWAQVSSMNATDHVRKLRLAGIPVYGLVRNNPACAADGIASMHTKFILFDDEVVHSGSYNLHFHLWGGNWENGLVYQSREAACLYRAIYDAIKNGQKLRLSTNRHNWYNLYYSFGIYGSTGEGTVRPQDAIISEIEDAARSVTVCMFDLSRLTGHETDIIDALIRARDRGVRVRLILNGMMAHTGVEPPPWDRDFRRPLKPSLQQLKDAWIELYLVYYWESIYSPLHHKFAVIDGRTVITESYNWFEASMYSDEVVSILRDEAIAARFLEEAELILARFRIVRA